jgi:putative aldouronate transport system substrate-binding protein
MKQRLWRFLSIIMTLVFVVTAFAGCKEATETDEQTGKSNTKEESNDKAASDLKHVTLRFYFFGDKRAETDKVWDTIAEKYKDKLNCDFEINFIPGTDYINKINTMAASGDDWDMNFDGDWLAYSQMVNKEAYLDITELLPKYAPDLYAKYQELGTLSAATVNDKVVALPWTMSMNQRPFFKWRSDIAEASGVKIDNDSVKTVEEYDAVLHQLAAANPDKKILERAFKELFLAKYELADIAYHNYVIDLNDPTCKAVPFEQTDAYKDLATYAKKWQDDGIIWKDVLVDQTDRNQMINEGLLITHMPSHEWVFAARPFTDANATVGYSLMYPDHKFADRTPLANVVAINANAKNPERTLMFLNLLETDKELYDLVQYGIEGETYVLDGETAKYPEGMDGASSNYMEWGGQWGLWKPQFMRPNPTYGNDFWKKEAEFATLPNNVSSPLDGFFADSSNVDNEVTRRDQVWAENNSIIQVGMVDDATKAVNDLVTKMKDAGTDTITANLQKQIDAFLASKK